MAVLVFLSAGCHQILPLTGATPEADLAANDASPDAVPLSDTGQPSDVSSSVEATLPDTGPSFYVDEDFATGLGVVTTGTGDWQWNSTNKMLCQSLTDAIGYYAWASVPARDYIVETIVTVNDFLPGKSDYQGAGLIIRVQPPSQPPSQPPEQYYCGIGANNGELVLSSCSAWLCMVTLDSTKTTPPVVKSQPYRLRASAIGNTITCELPDLGAKISGTSSTYTAGNVGLRTGYASACFDYLKVWKP